VIKDLLSRNDRSFDTTIPFFITALHLISKQEFHIKTGRDNFLKSLNPMKKYISLLSLIAAIILQSCDRTSLSSDSEDQILPKQKIAEKGSFTKSENRMKSETSYTNKTDTQDDDEPRKDKSHWRIQNDTVR